MSGIDEMRTRIAELEAEAARLKRQIAYGRIEEMGVDPTSPAALWAIEEYAKGPSQPGYGRLRTLLAEYTGDVLT